MILIATVSFVLGMACSCLWWWQEKKSMEKYIQYLFEQQMLTRWGREKNDERSL